MTKTITINLPFAIKSLNEIRKMHYHDYKHYRNLLERYMMPHKRTRFAGPVQITIWRHSSGTLDHDGMVGGGKPLIDALKNAGIIVDDTLAMIGKPDYQQVKINRKVQPMTVLVITDVEPQTAPQLGNE